MPLRRVLGAGRPRLSEPQRHASSVLAGRGVIYDSDRQGTIDFPGCRLDRVSAMGYTFTEKVRFLRITGNAGESPERSRHCNVLVLFMRKQPLCIQGKAKGTRETEPGDLPSYSISHQETFADEVRCSERAISDRIF